MQSRRSFLGRIAAGASVLGIGTTAGCLGAVPGTGDGPADAPGYASRLYDPGEVADLPTRTFASYDLATLYERRDLYPDAITERLEQTDAVSISDLDRLTGFGVATDDPRASRPDETSAAGSVMVRGSFDADRVVEQLRTQSGPTVSVESAGTVDGHDLYRIETATGGDSAGAVAAVSDETAFVGGAGAVDATGEDAVRAMLSADGGYYTSSDTARRLIDALGDPTTVVGAEFDPSAFTPEDIEDQPGGESLLAVVTGLTAAGTAMTLGEETVERAVVGVYRDGETPTEADIQDLLDLAAASINARSLVGTGGESLQQLVQDMEPSVDDRTLTIRVSRDTADLFEGGSTETPVTPETAALVAPSLAVVGAFVLGVGGRGRAAGPSDAVPQAQFDFEYDAGRDEVTVTHTVGDTFTRDNTDRLEVHVDGPGRSGVATWGVPVSAGDSRTVGAESGDTIRVVWVAPSGDDHVTLADLTVA